MTETTPVTTPIIEVVDGNVVHKTRTGKLFRPDTVHANKNINFVARRDEVVGLVGLTESIETGLAYLLDARSYLLVRESVTASEKMFILASAVDEDRFSIEQKPMCVGCRTLTD